jgi:hypothetical protein
MTIIVADRSGLAGVAIVHALKLNKKPDVEVVWSSVWSDIEFYLKKKRQTIIISVHLLSGFKTSVEFAAKVKTVNRETGFFVYNGMQETKEQDLGLHVDGYIPACKSRSPVESVIIPFFNGVIHNWSKRPVQLQLF